MELSNVCILYFAPDSKLGNGVAVFNGWHNAKKQKETELFARYMVNWVAGVKLIFIVLLLVIVFTAGIVTKLLAGCVLILSIATYYFRLNKIITELDEINEITPKGYSKTLFYMITVFIIMFTVAVGVEAFLYFNLH